MVYSSVGCAAVRLWRTGMVIAAENHLLIAEINRVISYVTIYYRDGQVEHHTPEHH